MLYAGLDSIGKTSLALGLISQKQRKLSANLANMDTPGYIRQDLDFAWDLVLFSLTTNKKKSTQLTN